MPIWDVSKLRNYGRHPAAGLPVLGALGGAGVQSVRRSWVWSSLVACICHAGATQDDGPSACRVENTSNCGPSESSASPMPAESRAHAGFVAMKPVDPFTMSANALFLERLENKPKGSRTLEIEAVHVRPPLRALAAQHQGGRWHTESPARPPACAGPRGCKPGGGGGTPRGPGGDARAGALWDKVGPGRQG